MRPETEARLSAKYPEFLHDSHEAGASPFGCGEGWAQLVETPLAWAKERNEEWQVEQDKAGRPTGGPGLPCRFKVYFFEKVATLRARVTGEASPGLDEVLWCVCWLAERTCETCGQPGKRVERNGWWTTACPQHAAPPNDNEHARSLPTSEWVESLRFALPTLLACLMSYNGAVDEAGIALDTQQPQAMVEALLAVLTEAKLVAKVDDGYVAATTLRLAILDFEPAEDDVGGSTMNAFRVPERSLLRDALRSIQRRDEADLEDVAHDLGISHELARGAMRILERHELIVGIDVYSLTPAGRILEAALRGVT